MLFGFCFTFVGSVLALAMPLVLLLLFGEVKVFVCDLGVLVSTIKVTRSRIVTMDSRLKITSSWLKQKSTSESTFA